jgi:anti-sigma factor (TIGR02949 family)
MNCVELHARVHPYVDGELSIDDVTAASAHLAACSPCAALVRRTRAFRRALRQQPREAAPPELRARIVAGVRREARTKLVKRGWWVAVPVATAAAVLLALTVMPAWRQPSMVIADLVDKHIAYAQLERPAELASTDAAEISDWFLRRADLRVTVPDYSPSGIRLIGARLAESHERRAAYLLYEKGRTLLSVFMLPAGDHDARIRGTRVSYRGQDYVTAERKGYHTVAWADGQAVFGLVSSLDYDALLECADRLRAQRAHAARV